MRQHSVMASSAWRTAKAASLVLLTLALVPWLTGVAGPPAALADPLAFVWSSGANVPFARFEAQGLAVGGKLYVFGGFYSTNGYPSTTQAHVYTLATNSWAKLADVPDPLTHGGQAADGDTIYIAGGYLGPEPGPSIDRVWKYHISTNTWSAAPNLPEPRAGGGLVRLGRELHYIGGATRTAGDNNSVVDHADHFVLNLDGGTEWTRARPMPNPRNHLGAAVVDGKIYIVGGQHKRAEGTTAQVELDVYDPASDSWQRLADLPLGRSHISSSTFALDGKLIVIGGSRNDGNKGTAMDDVIGYDPATNSWSVLTPLPSPRKTPVADVIDGKIVVTTGQNVAPTNTTWISAPPPAPGEALARINAGGPAQQLGGNNWSADQYFSGGNNSYKTTAAIAGTLDDVLYQTERSGSSFSYNLPVVPGLTYTVRLHFAEIYWSSAGKRKFNVDIEGGPVELQNYDIFADVGARTAVTKTFSIPVTDGALNIVFSKGSADRPKVSAIEVLAGPQDPPAAPTATATPTETTPVPPGTFREQNGQVVIEAEHYTQTITRSNKSWISQTDRPGFAGEAFMAVLPDSGGLINTNYITSSPELRFPVQFTITGTYYVWLRLYAENDYQDSIHAGIDGAGAASADRIGLTTRSAWTWTRNTLDGVPATIDVAAPGLHTINLWMREDGARVDRLLLTTSSSFVPTATGPAESPHP